MRRPLCRDIVATHRPASLIGEVQIVRLRRIFSCQRVNLLHHRQDAHLLAELAHQLRSYLGINQCLQTYGTGYLEIGEALHLGTAHQLGVHMLDGTLLLQLLVGIENVLQLLQEPFVYLRQVVNLVDGVSAVQRLLHHEHTLVGRSLEGGFYIINRQLVIAHKAVQTLTNHAQTLLDSLLERAANRHHLAHRLHRRA